MKTGLSWLKDKMPNATDADETLFLEMVAANRRYPVDMETARYSAFRSLINYKSTEKKK
jgi:hypothetical protein